MFEDAKGEGGGGGNQNKNRQYNDQMKKYKRTNNYQQNITKKTKD